MGKANRRLFLVTITFQIFADGVKHTARETFFESGRYPAEAYAKARSALTHLSASAELGSVHRVVSHSEAVHSKLDW